MVPNQNLVRFTWHYTLVKLKPLSTNLTLMFYDFVSKIVGNKSKGWISKRVFQENKARQILQKSKHFLPNDTHLLPTKSDSYSALSYWLVYTFSSESDIFWHQIA